MIHPKSGPESKMQNEPPKPELDEETIAFAQRVFQHARAGQAQELEAMLRMGLPPNLRNEKGDSLLMLASYHGHVDAVRVLLAHGADPELANDRGQTPLAGAAFKGDMATIQCLLDGGADANGRNEGGKTPLMIAALLARGADLQAQDAGGLTAEALASAMGAADTAGQLAKAARNS
jgi:ankyrin repeat protein